MRAAQFLARPLGVYKSFGAGTIKVTFDGNSIMNGAHASGYWLPHVVAARIAPMNGAQSVVNVAIGGHSYRMMNGLDGGSTADVDGAFDAAKYNILSIWDGTNSVGSGRTGQQAADDLFDYINARKASRAWAAIVVTDTVPRYEPAVSTAWGGTNQAAVDEYNRQLVLHNQILANNWKDMGITRLVQMRTNGSPFGGFPDWTLPTFERAQTLPLWSTAEPNGGGFHTHLSDRGFEFWAYRHNAELARLPT
jgi:hypothetical protein